jgi:hypothetical protein
MASMRYTRSLHSHTYGGSYTRGQYHNSDKFGGELMSPLAGCGPAMAQTEKAMRMMSGEE